MKIVLNNRARTAQQMRYIIDRVLDKSRFTADLEAHNLHDNHKRAKGGVVDVYNIRLRAAKEYCGNHPGECVVNFFRAERPHSKARYLEGADWVEFNDMLNNICDSYGVYATIFGSDGRRIYARKGTRRRIRYGHENIYHSGMLVGRVWERGDDPTDYADHCGGEPPISQFIEGTPGEYDADRAKRIVAHVMLIQKLCPGRFPLMSTKMAAIIGAFVGEEWVTPALSHFSITSDGFVVSDHHFLSHVSEFERNIHNLLDAAGLAYPERQLFNQLYKERVTDWRIDTNLKAIA